MALFTYILAPLAAAPALRALSTATLLRGLATSAVLGREKYYKITKYARPINNTKFHAGDAMPNEPIPAEGHVYPKYAYEPMFFKRQNRGLYAGLQRKASNLCSESGNKTKTYHLPNIVKAKLWSETLNRAISTRVSTTLFRTVDKEGGLDNYLLKDKPARIKTMGLKGWRLRYEIMKQKQIEEQSRGHPVPVYHVLQSGKNITVTKERLLEILYPIVYRETYVSTSQKEFLRSHGALSMEELVVKLEERGYDFSEITV